MTVYVASTTASDHKARPHGKLAGSKGADCVTVQEFHAGWLPIAIVGAQDT